MRRGLRMLSSLLTLLLTGCGAIEEPERRRPIDRFSELLIVDEELLADQPDPSGNVPALTWLLGELLGLRDAHDAALLAWLASWESASDRSAHFRSDVTCRWLQQTASNRCDADCSHCVEHALLDASAPFRLIGVAYRPDLALTPAADRRQAQLRLIYAVTHGAARDRASPELPLSIILELPLSTRHAAAHWATRFHALAALRADIPSYRRALVALVEDARVVDVADSVSLRVRDAAFGAGRMLAWAPRGAELVRIRLENTVDLTRTPESVLDAALAAHAEHASALTLQIPAQLWADTVDNASPLPSPANAALGRTLGLISCHGCHADDHSRAGFHVAPGEQGRARLSSFLHNPEAPDDDELARREDALRTLLAGAE